MRLNLNKLQHVRGREEGARIQAQDREGTKAGAPQGDRALYREQAGATENITFTVW